jgi:hypothetical protein
VSDDLSVPVRRPTVTPPPSIQWTPPTISSSSSSNTHARLYSLVNIFWLAEISLTEPYGVSCLLLSTAMPSNDVTNPPEKEKKYFFNRRGLSLWAWGEKSKLSTSHPQRVARGLTSSPLTSARTKKKKKSSSWFGIGHCNGHVEWCQRRI